ncbi:MAG: AraC family transcriptional regulator [Saprospiraceae bacterium]|nr:AraC family transcriptional regulator [Saprospiraceae bacterium]
MLYLSGIFLAFFLSFVLLTKRPKSPGDYILLAWMLVTGIHLLGFYLRFSDIFLWFPGFTVLSMSLPLFQGPFLYLYTRQQTSRRAFEPHRLLHFLPVLFSMLLFFNFHLLPYEQQVEVIRKRGEGFETAIAVNLYLVYLSGIFYAGLSYYRLQQYRKRIVEAFSNTEKINFNWLRYLILWMAAIWVVILFIREDRMIFASAALFVLWIGYFGIKQVRVFSQDPSDPDGIAADPDSEPTNGNADLNQPPGDSGLPIKYLRSSLGIDEARSIHLRLVEILEQDKPYLDPELSLGTLSKKLQVHPNLLSQVINSVENKSFYDLINERRVREFIRRLSRPENRQYTLLSLAFDCGFNSKASFNRNFKKYTGIAPSEYFQQLQTGPKAQA